MQTTRRHRVVHLIRPYAGAKQNSVRESIQSLQYSLHGNDELCGYLKTVTDVKVQAPISLGIGLIAAGKRAAGLPVAIKLRVVPNYAKMSATQATIFKEMAVLEKNRDQSTPLSEMIKIFEDWSVMAAARTIGESAIHTRLYALFKPDDEWENFSPIIPLINDRPVICSARDIARHNPLLVAELKKLFDVKIRADSLQAMLYGFGVEPMPDTYNHKLEDKNLLLTIMPYADYTLDYLISHPERMYRPALSMSLLLTELCCTLQLMQSACLGMHGDFHSGNVFISHILGDTSGACRVATLASDTKLVFPCARASSKEGGGLLTTHIADFDASFLSSNLDSKSDTTTVYRFALGAGLYKPYTTADLTTTPLADLTSMHPSFDLWKLAFDVVCRTEMTFAPGKADNRYIRLMLLSKTHPLSIGDQETRDDIVRLYKLLKAMLQRDDLGFFPGVISTKQLKKMSYRFHHAYSTRLMRLDEKNYGIPNDILQREWKNLMTLIDAVISTPTRLDSDHSALANYYSQEFFNDTYELFVFKLFHNMFDPALHSYPLKVLAGRHVSDKNTAFFTQATKLLGGAATSIQTLSAESFDASIVNDKTFFEDGINADLMFVPLKTSVVNLLYVAADLFNGYDKFSQPKK